MLKLRLINRSTITGITSTTSDGVLGAGDTLLFTAAISEELKADSEMTITLTNGATVSLAVPTTLTQ